MKKGNEQRTIKEMLKHIERNPGIYLGTNEKRLDYLCHFLDGWLINNECKLNCKYRAHMPNWVYSRIEKIESKKNLSVKFSFLLYQMIYNVTETEDEAWELFFKLSYEYLEQLESEEE